MVHVLVHRKPAVVSSSLGLEVGSDADGMCRADWLLVGCWRISAGGRVQLGFMRCVYLDSPHLSNVCQISAGQTRQEHLHQALTLPLTLTATLPLPI
jgi:hypothetical protein